MGRKLAIIGAGPSGLAAAWKLRHTDWEVTIFEKSRGVGGRATSRTREGIRLDPGANYFRTRTAEIRELVHRQLSTHELVRIEGDIWAFDHAGNITPGDPEQNAEEKWTYRSGISTLAKLLAAECEEATLHRATKIERIEAAPGKGWELTAAEGRIPVAFDAVLLTPPASQVVELLEKSPPHPAFKSLVEALEPVTYASQFSFTLAYARARLFLPENCYALINPDRRHPVAWLSLEDRKPGRIPADLNVFMAQMQPEWTRTHYTVPPEELALKINALIAPLIGEEGRSPLWFDHQRWRYAVPSGRIDRDLLAAAADRGLFLAGDALVGKARVDRALETGFEAARSILRVT